MDTLKKVFPLSFRNKTMKDLFVCILIYIAINIGGSLVCGLLSLIPILGALFGLLSAAIGIYTLTGVILASLSFWGLMKE